MFLSFSKTLIGFLSPKKLLQSNLSIMTTWGTKFLWLLWTGGCYKEEVCITAKTINSDIWSLYKGNIIFHLITHDTNSFLEKEKTNKFLNNIVNLY